MLWIGTDLGCNTSSCNMVVISDTLMYSTCNNGSNLYSVYNIYFH